MGKINLLPTNISDKIAAGEVVERPASVVKELVENAIDAGGTIIDIEIKRGGITYIRVTDNGFGMSREDAKIAFFRHATSKIKTESDLDAIYTLGFRGEALSSIGAVSQTELITKREEDEVGTLVRISGGVIEECTDVGVPNGTTMAVNNLFYNTPARMNFLKKDATEGAAVTDIVERFILSHPEISFRYTVDGKEKYFTAGDNNLIGAIYAVYGKNYANSVILVDEETSFGRIHGAIGKSDAARPNRNYQSFFVNKRYIKSLRMSATLGNAYKNQIMIGKYPMAILNIEIDPKFTDINVHPTKLEVKFSKEEEVMGAIYHTVQNALYAIPNVPKIEHKPAVKSEFQRDKITTKSQLEILAEPKKVEPEIKVAPKAEDEKIQEKPSWNSNKPYEAPLENKVVSSYALDNSKEYFVKKQSETAAVEHVNLSEKSQMAAEDLSGNKKVENISKPVKLYEDKEPEVIEIPEVIEPVESDGEKWGFSRDNVRVIGQIFGTYILAQSGDTMIIADQHAAHERLKYEELKAELAKKEVVSQMLLLPVAVELSAMEYVTFMENEANFSEMGFEIEDFGGSTILIRATPEALPEDELKSLVIELIDKLSNKHPEIITEKMERALYTIACKAAVKANHTYSIKELETLLFAVLDLENINTCPHGRPIIITMSKKELEKEFKRIV